MHYTVLSLHNDSGDKTKKSKENPMNGLLGCAESPSDVDIKSHIASRLNVRVCLTFKLLQLLHSQRAFIPSCRREPSPRKYSHHSISSKTRAGGVNSISSNNLSMNLFQTSGTHLSSQSIPTILKMVHHPSEEMPAHVSGSVGSGSR